MKSKALKTYQRRTVAADALIAATYLAGTNTRRVRRALTTLFHGAVSKDTVSTWRKVKTDWDAPVSTLVLYLGRRFFLPRSSVSSTGHSSQDRPQRSEQNRP